MNTTIAIPMNDVHSPEFESKLDQYFTSAVQSDRWGKYQRLDKSEMRSALSTTKPIRSKYWGNAELGISSPVRKHGLGN